MDRRGFLKTSMLATSGARVAAWLANPVPAANAAEPQRALPNEGPLPDLGGAVAWLNSPSLSGESLRGRVVLVNFWTYSCINSLRPLPYVKSWAAKYMGASLVGLAYTRQSSRSRKSIQTSSPAVWEQRGSVMLHNQGRTLGKGVNETPLPASALPRWPKSRSSRRRSNPQLAQRLVRVWDLALACCRPHSWGGRHSGP